jgi:hypothetical protein
LIPTDINTAREFIEFLTKEEYRTQELRWLFRGVQKASYPLLPAAFRQENPLPFGRIAKTEVEQVSLEFKAIFRFYNAAYREGLPIPGWKDTIWYLKRVQQRLENPDLGPGPIEWPDPSIWHLLAIAQHYGTPTRLLDWTWDALTAAYFAIPIMQTDFPPSIAVWILDMKAVKDERLQPVEIPYDLNANARAQHGVFLDHIPLGSLAAHGSDQRPLPPPVPLDKYLESKNEGDALTQVTLPGSQTPPLLHELCDRRVSGATLFPGYIGASRAERERMWWEKYA